MRSATQLLRSSLTSKAMSRGAPSATMIFLSAGDPLTINSTGTSREDPIRAFQVPVRLLVVAQFADRFVRLFVQARGHTRRYADGFRITQLHFTALRPDRQVVDSKIHQVALAVRNVSAPVAHAFDPPVVAQPIKFDITAAQPDALAVNDNRSSPLMRARKPALSVWYQMFSSHGAGVSTVEMKSTACVTSTMYSFAPMPSNRGKS